MTAFRAVLVRLQGASRGSAGYLGQSKCTLAGDAGHAISLRHALCMRGDVCPSLLTSPAACATELSDLCTLQACAARADARSAVELSWRGGNSVTNTQSAVQLLTRRTARLLFTNLRVQRWCFDVELVYLARHFKIPMVEEKVTWDEVPGTKIQWWAPATMAKDLLLVKVAYGTGAWVARGEETAVTA